MIDNKIVLYQALILFGREMSSYITKRMEDVQGKSLALEELAKALGIQAATALNQDAEGRPLLYFNQFLPVIRHQWQQCFAAVFPAIETLEKWLGEVERISAFISPNVPPMGDLDTMNALDIMGNILIFVNPAASQQLVALKRDIAQRDMGAGLSALSSPGALTPQSGMSQEAGSFEDLTTIPPFPPLTRLDPLDSTTEDFTNILEEWKRLDDLLKLKFRKHLTVMYTDLKGSTDIMEKLGDMRAGLLIKKHTSIIIPLIKSRGKLVKTMGDGTLSYFTTADNALSVALDILAALQEYDEREKPELPIKIRIGMHTGECIVQGNDILGDVVNVGARFESLANPGEIALSEDTYLSLSDLLKQHCRYCTSTTLKGKKDAFKVYRAHLAPQAAQEGNNSHQDRKKGAYIVIYKGNRKEDPLYLTKDRVVLGRSARKCDIAVKDPYISRRHAAIVRQGDAYLIEDLNSAAGVCVNNVKTTGQILHSGDKIKLGYIQIAFYDPAAEDFLDETVDISADPSVSAVSAVTVDISADFSISAVPADPDSTAVALPSLSDFNLGVLYGPGPPQEMPIGSGGLKIGRSLQESDVTLKNPAVSDPHAFVWVEGDKTYLKDLYSTNGTYMDGSKIPAGQAIEIPLGKRFTIGRVSFMIIDTREKAKDPAPASAKGQIEWYKFWKKS